MVTVESNLSFAKKNIRQISRIAIWRSKKSQFDAFSITSTSSRHINITHHFATLQLWHIFILVIFWRQIFRDPNKTVRPIERFTWKKKKTLSSTVPTFSHLVWLHFVFDQHLLPHSFFSLLYSSSPFHTYEHRFCVSVGFFLESSNGNKNGFFTLLHQVHKIL